MTQEAKIIDLHRRFPRLTAPKIADRLNCHPQFVSETARRLGLTLHRPEGLYRLGLAARDAGLTIAEIEQIARSRSVGA